MKFRKNPVVIDAVQYKDEMRTAGNLPDGVHIVPYSDELGDQPICHTLEGDMLVRDGDWIIRGVKGEYYPCRADICEMTYEQEQA